jgi:hypothetical protein
MNLLIMLLSPSKYYCLSLSLSYQTFPSAPPSHAPQVLQTCGVQEDPYTHTQIGFGVKSE